MWAMLFADCQLSAWAQKAKATLIPAAVLPSVCPPLGHNSPHLLRLCNFGQTLTKADLLVACSPEQITCVLAVTNVCKYFIVI